MMWQKSQLLSEQIISRHLSYPLIVLPYPPLSHLISRTVCCLSLHWKLFLSVWSLCIIQGANSENLRKPKNNYSCKLIYNDICKVTRHLCCTIRPPLHVSFNNSTSRPSFKNLYGGNMQGRSDFCMILQHKCLVTLNSK